MIPSAISHARIAALIRHSIIQPDYAGPAPGESTSANLWRTLGRCCIYWDSPSMRDLLPIAGIQRIPHVFPTFRNTFGKRCIYCVDDTLQDLHDSPSSLSRYWNLLSCQLRHVLRYLQHLNLNLLDCCGIVGSAEGTLSIATSSSNCFLLQWNQG